EYGESSAGKTITFGAVTARYVRLWSNASTVNIYTHSVEAEVYSATGGATATATSTAARATATATVANTATPTATPTTATGLGNVVGGYYPNWVANAIRLRD